MTLPVTTLPVVYGLDPDETWEIDFRKASAEFTLERLARSIAAQQAAAEQEKDAERKAALLAAVKVAEEKRAQLAASLAVYTPGPDDPVFTVGPLPNGKRAAILGESFAMGKVEDAVEYEKRDTAWAEEVVRWSVRGHRNLRSGKSRKDLAFETEEADFAGGKRQVVARKTLERYGRFVGELALVILRSQRLDDPNA